MSRGVNKVIIVGNCGDNPETRYTTSGTAITTVSVATSEIWKDKEGDKQERTEWHRLKFFGKLAEIVGEYVIKGMQIYVEGKNQTDKWTDKEGVERYTTNVVCHEMQMLGSKPGGSDKGKGGNQPARGSRGADDGSDDRMEAAKNKARQAAGGGTARQSEPQQGGFDDDDIPF